VAWLLAQAWPDAELHLVRTGHTGGQEMTEHELMALDQFGGVTRRRPTAGGVTR
jgi:hypothetical protein